MRRTWEILTFSFFLPLLRCHSCRGGLGGHNATIEKLGRVEILTLVEGLTGDFFTVSIFTMATKKTCLLHPLIDALMIGGLSLIFLAFFMIFVPDQKSTHSLGWTMFYVSFFVNFPHFLISYQFLYIDNFKKIYKDRRCFIAGFLVPYALIAYTLYAGLFLPSKESLGYMANGLFFLVGWHYVKQIMGCVIVTSALKGFYFSANEKTALLANCIGVWMISYLGGNLHIVQNLYYGVPYKTFAFPSLALNGMYSLTLISLCYLIFKTVKKFLREKKYPPVSALLAFATLYAWHIPALYDPAYFLMIPCFHSLQYLLFAFAYTKNRYTLQANTAPQPGKIPPTKPANPPRLQTRALRAQKTKALWKAGFYILTSFVTGALFFHFIPDFLDKSTGYNKTTYGPQVFMFIFHIFLNIHHYFIDFAVWRRDNDNIQKYLFQR